MKSIFFFRNTCCTANRGYTVNIKIQEHGIHGKHKKNTGNQENTDRKGNEGYTRNADNTDMLNMNIAKITTQNIETMK